MLTGMREAIRALRMMKGDREEVASLKASQADTSTAKKRRQVELFLWGAFFSLRFWNVFVISYRREKVERQDHPERGS